MASSPISLRLLGSGIKIECRDSAARDLILANYGQAQARTNGRYDLEYRINRNGAESQFRIERQGRKPLNAADEADLVFLLEKDLTIELQKLRHDLFFIHAAALGFRGAAVLLVAASGQGKSTTSWALLQHGFEYLSDELAPLDLERFEVEPYPHALCLKREPPHPYLLPVETVRTSSTLHVPAQHLPSCAVMQPMPLGTIFLLEYCPESRTSAVHALSKSEAAARLFVQALNPLAHPEDGLAGVAAVAERVPTFRLDSVDLGLTCELIQDTVAQAAGLCRDGSTASASRSHAL